MSPPVILIAGATACGKSALALRLAERLDGVVVNADSMQLYRELRVLTARPTPEDEARVPHRLYGILSVAERGSVGRWLTLAKGEIAAAAAAGKAAVVVGGSGLYFAALTEGLAEVPEIPESVRAEARALMSELGPARFRQALAEVDPTMCSAPPDVRSRSGSRARRSSRRCCGPGTAWSWSCRGRCSTPASSGASKPCWPAVPWTRCGN
jgi:tRNA dimethylallyltransferase